MNFCNLKNKKKAGKSPCQRDELVPKRMKKRTKTKKVDVKKKYLIAIGLKRRVKNFQIMKEALIKIKGQRWLKNMLSLGPKPIRYN